MRPFRFLALVAWVSLLACTSLSGPDDEVLRSAIAGEHRSAEHRARDVWRHPYETLSFFGLDPGQTVVEILPGAGWYTEILAPSLQPSGELILATYGPESEGDYRQRSYHNMVKKLKAEPGVYAGTEIVLFDPPAALEIAEPGSVDAVLTFRSTHHWVRTGVAEEAYAAFFRALKPGGTLGVVQHRAPAGADPLTWAKRGYVPQAYLVALVEAQGFELVESSEVNANPRDSKDHPDGVWDLPPVLMGPAEDRERYLAIGESDRMTLRFEKPAE